MNSDTIETLEVLEPAAKPKRKPAAKKAKPAKKSPRAKKAASKPMADRANKKRRSSR